MFSVAKSFDMTALIQFGKGYLKASKNVEVHLGRKNDNRVPVAWLDEELKELSESTTGDDALEVCRELGDVLFVTCYVLAEKHDITMEDALSMFLREAGNKWLGTDL